MPKKKNTRIVSSNQTDTVKVDKRVLFIEGDHKNDCLELEYVTSGEGNLVYRGKSFPLKRGCIFMVRRTDRHSYRFYDVKGTVYRIVLPDRCLPDNIRRVFIKNKQRCVVYTKEKVCKYLDSLFELLLACRDNDLNEDALYTRESLINIIVMMYFDLFNRSGGQLDPEEEELKGVTDAKYYIWEHYLEKMTLEDIAKAANMHPRYLSRIFKKHIGQAVFAYIKEYRLTQAAVRFRGTDESVAKICEDCGYSNYANFMRDFKVRFKLTPLEYREKYKGVDLPKEFEEEMDRSEYVVPQNDNDE